MELDRRDFLQSAFAIGTATRVGPGGGGGNGVLALQSGQSLAVTRTTVFDPKTKSLVPDQTILIRGDRIAAVGPAGGIEVAAGTRVIDGRGRFVLPGLIDAHVHLTHILYQARMTGDDVLPLYLAHGVTAVRSTGDNVPAQGLLRRHAERNPNSCPRLFLGSFLIDGPSIDHPDVGWTITDPEAVPGFVEDMAGWGVTTLKIYVGCDRAVGRRVIEEGHRRGLVVAGHLEHYRTPDAVADGIDSLEHIYTVADFLRTSPNDRHSVDITSDAAKRLIEAIVLNNVAVNPTLMVFWGTLFFVDQPEVVNHPDNATVPRRLREYWQRDNPRRLDGASAGSVEIRRRTFRTYQELVGMLHRAGAAILVGTDAPEPQVPPGTSFHHELELLVESGLTPADALHAATLQNAKILKQEDQLGSIEPGKLADLVVLDANPLARIQNTRRIEHVVLGGRVLAPADILGAVPRD